MFLLTNILINIAKFYDRIANYIVEDIHFLLDEKFKLLHIIAEKRIIIAKVKLTKF